MWEDAVKSNAVGPTDCLRGFRQILLGWIESSNEWGRYRLEKAAGGDGGHVEGEEGEGGELDLDED
jgi:hypothetical protein